MRKGRIHACMNDYILFRKEYAFLNECPVCKTLRYKKGGSAPAKIMYYFSLIPRLRHMHISPDYAKHLTWHADDKIKDGMLRHPADACQWKNFDVMYLEFAVEPRNLRFVLPADGMNPYGAQSTSHSTWPAVMAIYNLPPWLCMKRKYMMLLWKEVYMGHRKFSPDGHEFREAVSMFDENCENREPPTVLTGEEVFEKVKNFKTILGKENSKLVPSKGWKKCSIFWELSYWKDLPVRHFIIVVMHQQKNVTESFLGTLLGVKGKTKDIVNARKDLVHLGIREELIRVKNGTKTYCAPAVHILSK
ncbi:hypothetical protein LIER_01994 [Lithospermum erythrorhizon]|uniref:Uncharacterized protein n=1 Tax=Lithospermum erythrorhizon TaxID=34254 RepID=A0AAV3NRK9_LITER